jgi:pyruvate ferredoxin oxidoreductase alpha subunit
MSIGAMVGPEAFTEVRYLAHHKQLRALERIPALSDEFEALFGRASGGLLRTYRTEDADTIVVALGSVNGTIQDVVDEMREEGVAIGSLSICSYRPFPVAAVREALEHADRVVVIDKSLAVGLGGMLAADVRIALSGLPANIYTVIAGLGGRAVTKASLHKLFRKAERDALDPLTFLDLNSGIIQRHLERENKQRRSGPVAENILRDMGAVAARIG